MGCCGANMRMRNWRRMNATGYQASNMSHIDHQIGSDFIGDFPETLPVPNSRIGRTTGEDKLGLGFTRKSGNLVHVNQMIVLTHAIRYDIEPLARHIDWRSVG